MGDNRMVSFSLGGMAFEYEFHLRVQRVSSLTMTESSFMMRIIAMTKIDITP